MEKIVVAVPSVVPGELDSQVDAHFGHCAGYTLVTLEDGKVAGHVSLASVPHEQGGCMAPVNHLAGNGVQVLISGGMGMRPLQGFDQVGIQVFYGGGAATVGEAVAALAAGRLQRFSPENTCGGGAAGGCGNH